MVKGGQRGDERRARGASEGLPACAALALALAPRHATLLAPGPCKRPPRPLQAHLGGGGRVGASSAPRTRIGSHAGSCAPGPQHRSFASALLGQSGGRPPPTTAAVLPTALHKGLSTIGLCWRAPVGHVLRRTAAGQAGTKPPKRALLVHSTTQQHAHTTPHHHPAALRQPPTPLPRRQHPLCWW